MPVLLRFLRILLRLLLLPVLLLLATWALLIQFDVEISLGRFKPVLTALSQAALISAPRPAWIS